MRLPFSKRSDAAITLGQLAEWLQYGNNSYLLSGGGVLESKQERPRDSFDGYVQALYKGNGVVFACMEVRKLLFSEARFKFRQMRSGRTGDLFGTPELQRLEVPWPNGTTGDLLSRAIQDADLCGNFYALRDGLRLRRLRPDWVTIVLGSKTDSDHPEYEIDAEIAGYLYWPGGIRANTEPVGLTVETVAHWAPIPDPVARYRGMSWLTPVIDEVMSDAAATSHKLKYFENGAGQKLAMKMDPNVQIEAAKKWIELFKQEHEGVANRFKTMFLGGGMDPVVVGATLEQSSFKATQGAGETRIAAAAGVPPVIVGLSEGLQAATYSNYAQARRRFADQTMRPLWRSIAGALQTVITVPGGAELWYDDRDIPALQEDQKDAAEIRQTDATTMKTLVDAGYTPESSVVAVNADDMSLLVHSGLVSVQLQPPGTGNPVPVPAVNGSNGRALEIHNHVPAAHVPDVYVRTPDVRVSTPEVRVETPVFVEPQAIHNHVAPAEVTVQPADIRVDAPVTNEFTVETPDVRIDAPVTNEFTVETPDVSVAPAEVRNEFTVESPDVHVDVHPAKAPNVKVEAAQVHVEPQIELNVPKRSVTLKREDGTTSTFTEEDED